MSSKRLLFLIVITLSIAFSFQGSGGLFETTEGRYAEASREMLETHNWITPILDYKPHWTKPPLIYWCIALSIKMFGVNTWGAKLCNSFIYCIIVVLITYLSFTLWGSTAAFIGGMIGATGLFLIVGLQSLSTDLLLSFWELLSVTAYWKALKTQSTRINNKWIILLWFSTGAAFLTKGPPSLLTICCIIIFNYIQKIRKKEYTPLFRFPVLCVSILAAFTWYAIVVMKNPGLLNYYLTDEVAGRILTSQHHRNPAWYASLYIYILPLIISLGPWVYFWIKALLNQKRKWSALFKKDILDSPENLFFCIWLFIPLTILSIVKSRLILYMLPFYPSMVLLTTILIIKIGKNNYLKNCQLICCFTAILIIIIKGTLPQIPSSKNMYQLYSTIKTISSGNIQNYRVISLHNDKLYGLQYYLHGNLLRIDDKNEIASVEGLITFTGVAQNHSTNTNYILIDDYPKSITEQILQRNMVSYSRYVLLKKYTIYKFSQKAK